MNDISEIQRLQYQIDATKAVTAALFKSQPYKSAEARSIEYIQRCDLSNLVPLLDAMIERMSDETGLATDLEDARDVLCAAITELDGARNQLCDEA